jgi:hypothetical protein
MHDFVAEESLYESVQARHRERPSDGLARERRDLYLPISSAAATFFYKHAAEAG